MEHIVDALPVKYKEKICRDFVKCSRLSDCPKVKNVITKCFKWRDYDPYDFLKKLTCHLAKKDKDFLCEKTCSASYKEKKCNIFDGAFCHEWFDHLSELDFVEKPKKVRMKKSDLKNIDNKIQDIADRWNIPV
jgi:hypothetical protein